MALKDAVAALQHVVSNWFVHVDPNTSFREAVSDVTGAVHDELEKHSAEIDGIKNAVSQLGGEVKNDALAALEARIVALEDTIQSTAGAVIAANIPPLAIPAAAPLEPKAP